MQHTNSQCPHQRTYNSCCSSSSRWQRCCYQQMIGCCLRGTVIFLPISTSSHVFHLNSEILRFRYLVDDAMRNDTKGMLHLSTFSTYRSI
mmetsp:Transcript_60330/g.67457  ORF Transcript_60330/g.67457 Transcript_60330/m.67457 type:complete len:90 (-) Transcript_60330:54-323(-)